MEIADMYFQTSFRGKKKLFICKTGPRRGRNLLLNNGFIQCPNPYYLKNIDYYVHYDRNMKGWILESAINIVN